MSDDFHEPSERPAQEPSVLDYLRSKLSFGRRPAIELPPPDDTIRQVVSVPSAPPAAGTRPAGIAARRLGRLNSLPWRTLVALGLGLLAQSILEPPGPPSGVAIGMYVVALGFVLWSALRGEWRLADARASSGAADPFVYRRTAFLVAIPLALVAFLAFTDNLFTGFNLTLWLAALALIVSSLWLPEADKPTVWRRLSDLAKRRQWEIQFDRWSLLVLAAVGLVLFFRLYHLQQTPAEPFSDHAEKLLDVYDVSLGQTHIFFPRNTGREALQMYWTLLVSWVFGTGFSFMSLKLGTSLIGLLTLPYMYLLGKEVGGRRLGLLALVLTGIAYWPNVISPRGSALSALPDVCGAAHVVPDPRLAPARSQRLHTGGRLPGAGAARVQPVSHRPVAGASGVWAVRDPRALAAARENQPGYGSALWRSSH